MVDGFAVLGQTYIVFLTYKQLVPQFLLQQLDMVRHGRLSSEQIVGGPGKAAGSGNFRKCFKMCDFHVPAGCFGNFVIFSEMTPAADMRLLMFLIRFFFTMACFCRQYKQAAFPSGLDGLGRVAGRLSRGTGQRISEIRNDSP